MRTLKNTLIPQSIIDDICEWAIMHGVAFKQSDNTARHCPFSIAPMTMKRATFEHLLKVIPLITKLISNVSEDHDFLQSALKDMAKADPFFGRLMSLHQQAHGDINNRLIPARKPLLIMRTDFMEDRQHGVKVIEFNGIAAGMAPFGQFATQLHQYVQSQHNETYKQWQEVSTSNPAENGGHDQLAYGIELAASNIKTYFNEQGPSIFLMIIQENEDNVYDQHLLELALQNLGVRTVRRTFKELSNQLTTGDNQRLLLKDVGAIDVVYLRAGYQYSDYWAPDLNEPVCCERLSQIRLFIEQHHVAMNATIGQQLATSKSMQMLLTIMAPQDYSRWGLTLDEALLVKSVFAEMKPVNENSIQWFNLEANKQGWVLKNQGEGGGHCIFGNDISNKLNQLRPAEYDAWALMQRLYPHEREKSTVAIRDGEQTQVADLVSEIGLFSAFFQGEPVTQLNGYAGYLIRSKPASENEGGIHSGKGILDSLMLTH